MISYASSSGKSSKSSTRVTSRSVASSRRSSVSSIMQPLLDDYPSSDPPPYSIVSSAQRPKDSKSHSTITYSPFDPYPPAPSSSASSLKRSSSVSAASIKSSTSSLRRSSSVGSSSSSKNSGVERVHRPVTCDMIQVVQAMAPNLTSAQIIYDLQRTGSVELTMRRYLANGNRLPHPPRESQTSVRSSSTYNPDNFPSNTYPSFSDSLRKFTHEHHHHHHRMFPRNFWDHSMIQ